jgi:hypothetical protein
MTDANQRRTALSYDAKMVSRRVSLALAVTALGIAQGMHGRGV